MTFARNILLNIVCMLHFLCSFVFFINFLSFRIENNADFDAVSSKRANFGEVQFLKI